MGTTLTGTTPASTYDSLIKVTDNDSLDATLKTLSDGLGNDSALALSTLGMKLNVSATLITDPASISHYGINNYLYVRGGTAGLVLGDDALSNRIEFVDGAEVKFETNSTERLRITSAGNVGIGTTSPSTFGKLGITALNSATKSAIGIGVNQNGSNASPYTNALIEAMTLGGTAESGIYSINTFFDNSRNDIAIRTSATSGAIAERVRFTENGMTFNGDTAAANALDDYEEGTWTPVLSNGSTEVAISHTYATYTKIGRQVTVNARTVNGDLSSFSLGDNISFTGIPFAAGGDYYSTVYVRGATAGNLVRLIQSSNGSSRLSTDLLVSELVDDTTDYWFTITYFV